MRINNTYKSALVLSAALGLTLTTTGCNSGSKKEDAGSVRPASPAASVSPAGSPAAPANGIEKQSAQKILAAARKATASAASLRIKGQIKEGGQTIGVDFSYSGKAAIGELTMDGQRLAMTRIGSAVYVKPDDKFLQKVGGKGAVQTLAGKYLKTKPGDKDFADIVTFTTLSKVVTGILTAEGAPAKGEAAQLEGRPAIALTDGGSGKLYVSTVGEPYALRLDGGADGRIDFLDYGKAVTVQAPPSNQVVDVSALKGAGG